MSFPMIPFTEYCKRVREHLETFHGIRVVMRDIPGPLKGDLDGAEIHIDNAVNPEQRLFLLAHLFGHTVQWNIDARAFALGRPRQPPVREDLLPALMEYEREAASYALGLFCQIDIADARQWLSDYTACDMAYLFHYYRTAEKKNFASFWRHNTDPIQPRRVPPFTLTKRTFRLEGIVI